MSGQVLTGDNPVVPALANRGDVTGQDRLSRRLADKFPHQALVVVNMYPIISNNSQAISIINMREKSNMDQLFLKNRNLRRMVASSSPLTSRYSPMSVDFME